jgi:5'-3' exonuclease
VTYLVDASIYIFRAWFSIPDSVTGDQGQPINAAYGFARFLTELLEKTKAEQIVVAFDESLTRSFRNEMYPPYKMNRELPPAELKAQFELCRKMTEALGLHCVSSDRYEADDLIGTFALAAQNRGEKVTIVSADKDLAQLLGDDDILWDFARRQEYQTKEIQEKFGVFPSQIADYLGLCGDAVDNIPGVPGIGSKTAAAILQEYSNIDHVYENLDFLSNLSVRGAKSLSAKLREHEDQARMSKQLAIIVTDIDIECGVECTRRAKADLGTLQKISMEMGGRAGGLFERVANST